MALINFRRYIQFSHCRAILPWFSYARKSDATSLFRRLVAEAERPCDGKGMGFLCMAALLYPLSSIRQAARAMRGNAARTKREHGVGILTQMIDLLYWTMRLNHHPYAYYNQHISIRRDRHNWRHFIDHREQCKFLETYRHHWDASICTDKRVLFKTLRAAGIPVISILLAAEKGVVLSDPAYTASDEDFRHNLILKPVDGQQEAEIEYWHFLPVENQYLFFPHMGTRPSEEEDYRRPLSRAELVVHVVRLSLRRPFVVQRWLKNHPTIEPISPHFIGNFRLVTSQLAGEIRLSASIFRLGFDRCASWPNATYVSNIDPSTGILGPATSCFAEFGYRDHHIETGNVVTGVKLAGWPEMKRIACLAHRYAPTVPNIGWDIIHTTEGVYIMEGNLFFGADIVQIAGPLLGETYYTRANVAGLP
jgi:hypothetical protein